MTADGTLLDAPAARSRLDSLTALRFFAALVVVLSHTTRDLAPVPVVSMFAVNGSVGVGFFFALSGFVLAWSHRGGDRAAAFYRRRFARVYPLHIVTYAAAFPVLLIAGENMGSASVNPTAAIASPLLVQAWFPAREVQFGMNGPSWSLSDEAFFYLLFPVLLPIAARMRRTHLVVAIVALIALAGSGAVLLFKLIGTPADDGLYVDPAWRLLEFLSGVLVARAVRAGFRVRVPLPLVGAATASAFLLLPALRGMAENARVLQSHGVLDAVMLPFFLLLIAAAAQADLDGRAGLRGAQWVALGTWSFALYLTHWLLIDLVVGVWPSVRSLAPAPALASNVAVVAAAILLAFGSYRFIEVPFEARLRGGAPRPVVIRSSSRERRRR